MARTSIVPTCNYVQTCNPKVTTVLIVYTNNTLYCAPMRFGGLTGSDVSVI